MLYGFDFGTGISAPLARLIYATGKVDLFWSQFTADMLIDLLDKTITVLTVALILHLLPESFKRLFYSYSWQPGERSINFKKEEQKLPHHKSLRRTIILMVASATLVTAIVVTTISFIHYRTSTIKEQTQLAYGIANVIQDSFDHDRVDDYLTYGEACDGYLESEAIMKRLMDSSDNVEYCYVYRILEDGCHVVFDPDSADLPGEDPGTIVPFDEAFRDYLPALLAGEKIEPVISNESYGWLLTVYEPVYDSNGVCQCYAAVDINMNHISTEGYQFLASVISLFFAFFVMILALAIWMAEYSVIFPINSMAVTTNHFDFNSAESRIRTIETIEQLEIHTGNEIENLYDAIVKTTKGMAESVDHMQKQSEVITKMQNGLILVLADIVESRDQNTGDHVRKTAAYTNIIMRQLKKEGIYQDVLTEDFIDDVINSAPLHDIGKIQVPDAILNKPGKLTDEEFEQMKAHTTAGSEIISRVISKVSKEDSGYLYEARNLAQYHHEKWNGTGYPCGLKGEDIPLSARIMAVADVFDALVSKRSYKDGFPFEKAMAIISEGRGIHFDPHVADAFIHASDEVREVMNSYV